MTDTSSKYLFVVINAERFVARMVSFPRICCFRRSALKPELGIRKHLFMPLPDSDSYLNRIRQIFQTQDVWNYSRDYSKRCTTSLFGLNTIFPKSQPVDRRF